MADVRAQSRGTARYQVSVALPITPLSGGQIPRQRGRCVFFSEGIKRQCRPKAAENYCGGAIGHDFASRRNGRLGGGDHFCIAS